MFRKTTLLICLILTGQICFSQSGNHLVHSSTKSNAAFCSGIVTSACKGKFTPISKNQIYCPIVKTINFPNTEKYSDSLSKQKHTIAKSTSKNGNDNEHDIKSTEMSSPEIGETFIGNANNGCPPDNSIAIANNGNIISMVNSNIYYFDDEGNTVTYWDLSEFINDPYLSANICDPKIIYDSEEDKFIFYAQTCDGSSYTSKVIVAFSVSNNPEGGWWIYELTGDPLDNNSWFDYPKIALTENEIVITGNLFNNSGSFQQAVVYQINKFEGYSGSSLYWQYWYGLTGNPFTLLPLRYGHSGFYGNELYMVSTSAGGSNFINIYKLTDQISATSEVITFDQITTDYYSISGNSSQYGVTDILHTGDCRAMDGYYLNGIMHFVHHVDDGGWSAVRYYRINVSPYSGSYFTITNTGEKDYCYPSISSISEVSTDASSYLTFTASGPSIYPEIRGKKFDNSFNTESSILIKGGDGPVYQCYDPNKYSDRWGDYSGSARKFNAPNPTIWISSCYGNNSGYWNTYIAEIYDLDPGDAISNAESEGLVTVFPNPGSNYISVEFESTVPQQLYFNLLNANGQFLDKIYTFNVMDGSQVFSFSANSLASGTYFIQICSNEKILKNEIFNVIH